MKPPRCLSPFLVVFALVPTAVATNVFGTISTTTWEAANSPYRAIGTITVPSGNTLTIEAGVDVFFDAVVQFRVEGRLHAVGTEADSIRFIRGAAPEWGGIRISGGDSSTIHYARVSDGHAEGNQPDHDGGGVFVSGTNTRLALANAVIRANAAADDGGGLAALSGIVTLSHCIISGNVAGDAGGGIYAGGATATPTNCTIAGNSASSGGGLYASGSTVALTNCILWGNEPGGIGGYGVTVTYSNVDGGRSGAGNLDVDPLFADPATGNYRLQPILSPCIDTGDPSGPNDPDGTRADMGALYSHQISPPTEVSGTVYTTTWEKANSPYRVTGPITVVAGEQLTIEPGVYVLFDANVEFVMAGKLQAVGTEADSIRFVKRVSEWGGLRFVGGDSSTLAYVRISGGKADASPNYDGGGVSIIGSAGAGISTRVLLSHVVVSDNYARYKGGGLYIYDNATATLNNCTVSRNTAGDDGGGLYAYSSTAALTNCAVDDNVASDNGGGLFVYENATVALAICTVSVNVASDNGGGLYVSSNSTAVLDDCAMSSNRASYDGGGLYVSNSTVTLAYCNVSRDSASYGGGLYLYSSTATLKNCTIAYNIGADNGGGIYARYGTTTLLNSILWGNYLGSVFNDAGTITATYCDIFQSYGTYPGAGNKNANPLFRSAANEDYRLRRDSPCVDTGDPNEPANPDGSRADMGAYPLDKRVAVQELARPLRFSLSQNAPNPFNPTTTIRFSLPEPGRASLTVYDHNGRLVRKLVNGAMSAGTHEIAWGGRDALGRLAGSGVYLYRLASRQGELVRRMLLVR